MPVDTRGRSWDNPTVLSVLCDVVSVIGVVQLADVGDAAATTSLTHTALLCNWLEQLDDAAASAAGVLLISHGTGTMAAAAAFESGLCSLHPMTGFWVDLQSSDPLENLGTQSVAQ